MRAPTPNLIVGVFTDCFSVLRLSAFYVGNKKRPPRTVIGGGEGLLDMKTNTLTKRRIEERLFELEAEIAMSECFDASRETAALKDEACALAMRLASHDYHGE
jgi:hypothetical protein